MVRPGNLRKGFKIGYSMNGGFYSVSILPRMKTLHSIEPRGRCAIQKHPIVFPGSASVSYFMKGFFLMVIEAQGFVLGVG
jgi:hypothetical protein